jgi:hypothetical protein
MKTGESLIKKIVGLSPSLFDVIVCAYLCFISFWGNVYETRIMFNLGVIFILCCSIFLKPIREYRSLPLALFTVWTFISIFLHSYKSVFDERSIIMKYINVFVLSEGFIYVFSGAFLFYLVIKYSKQLWFYILTICVCLLPLFNLAVYHGKMTWVTSFLGALFIYALVNRKYIWVKISVGLASSGLLLLGLKYILLTQQEAKNVLYYKFSCRPYIWIQMFKNFQEHWVIGSGFPHYLGFPNMMWVDKIWGVTQGWLFKHNDYLGIGIYLGIPAIILILWFVLENYWRVRKSAWSIGVLTIALIPTIQCAMFDVYRASLFLVIAAICVRMGAYETT